MLPGADNDLLSDFEYASQPNDTYKMNFDNKHIRGRCNDLTSIKQAIYKILNTERYENIIYSWNYGIELKSLYGKPLSYIIPEIRSRIKEALLQDDRIDNVDDFDFSKENEKLIVTFTVHTNMGNIESEVEVVV